MSGAAVGKGLWLRQRRLPTAVVFPHDAAVQTDSESRRGAWLAPCAVAIVVTLSLWPSRPALTGEETAPSEFSTERALRHLRVIAAEPHPMGSADSYRVHDYLVEQLRRLELEVHDIGTWRSGQGDVLRNIAGRLRGTSSSGAILVGAHYDSVPHAPGAGDNGAAVASALETARALCSGEPLRNDVIFLFTDGEERGLLGAREFVRSHPWRQDIGLALNFDARGSAGPLLMYETSPGAGRLVREYAGAAPHPIAGSVMADIYDRMPNLTDFTVYARAGYPGLNFAFIGGYQTYHDPSDSVANLDRRTLTHQGLTMLALVRRFGGLDLPVAAGENVAYFNPVGSWLVLYPAWLTWPLTLVGLALLVFAVWAGARAGRVRVRCLPGGLAVCSLAVLGSVVLSGAMTVGALLAVNGAWSRVGHTDADALFFVSITLLTVAVVCRVFGHAGRRCRVDELTLGVAVAWGLLLVATSVWLPGGSGLVLWALAPCTLALCSGYLGRRRARDAPRVGVYLAWAAVTLAVMAPLVHLLYQAMMLSLCVVAVPLVALTAGLLWPVLHRVAGRLSAVSAVFAVVLWGVGWVMA